MKRASLYSGSRRRVVGASGAAQADPGVSRDRPAGSGSRSDAATAQSVDDRAGASPAVAPPRLPGGAGSPQPAGVPPLAGAPTAALAIAPKVGRWRRIGRGLSRLLVPGVAAAAGALLVIALQGGLVRGQRPITQKDIDQAVLNTLESQPLPSPAAKAYRVIGPSVVRVQAFGPASEGPAKGEGRFAEGKGPEGRGAEGRGAEGRGTNPASPGGSKAKTPPGSGNAEPAQAGPGTPRPGEAQIGVGTGVVIKETGLILTNLHVVGGAKRIAVVFADGSESEAVVTGARPEHDLAILQARDLPDDLEPATMRSTGDLREGDAVVAVGFPFDIGPSVTAGVISGFGREYRSTSGERVLTNLIQFDAAANPGSSGGPLVTMEGEVIGIVTAILNPNNQRSFVGIGFAVPIENAASAVGVPPH